MPKERLDKIISNAQIASRKEAKALIKQGRVTAGGKIAVSPDEKYDTDTETVLVDGAKIECGRFRYFMLNKPQGILSATEDGRQRTVLDLLEPQDRKLGLFPVGRLDKDTTGLLILTNDGDYTHRVISPKKHVPKNYLAVLDRALGNTDKKAFADGLVLGDGTQCLPASLDILSEDGKYVRVTVFEGKYHQVKRMIASRSSHVEKLKRISIGALDLDETLRPGEYRQLTPEEKELVFDLKCEI